MRDLSVVQKLSPQAGLVSGPAVAFPFIKADDDVGIRAGITEFGVGEHKMELPYCEGLYILEGEISLEADGTVHDLKAGDFLWLPANRTIVYRAKEPCKFFYVIRSA